MPGGAKAIRQPWRMAAIYLQQAFGDDFLKLDLPFVEPDRLQGIISCDFVDSFLFYQGQQSSFHHPRDVEPTFSLCHELGSRVMMRFPKN